MCGGLDRRGIVGNRKTFGTAMVPGVDHIRHTHDARNGNIIYRFTWIGKEDIFTRSPRPPRNVHFASTGTVKSESAVFDPAKKFGFWITFDGVVGFDTG